ncbi:hypothetical protein E4K67_09170 [Desulfosporosinus fructosivorans]|uniref:Uncharacterized protein n=1 Tax=Desulfosporosinus fructosivorans TaxID=2018669 RepID=A0A4Z0R731_9FIRM|nr:hypothetical protein E4K67_09170 [Desulfosporosinus fructosivorans]
MERTELGWQLELSAYIRVNLRRNGWACSGLWAQWCDSHTRLCVTGILYYLKEIKEICGIYSRGVGAYKQAYHCPDGGTIIIREGTNIRSM